VRLSAAAPRGWASRPRGRDAQPGGAAEQSPDYWGLVQGRSLVAAGHPMPPVIAGHPVLQPVDVVEERLTGTCIQVEFIEEGGQLGGDEVFELAQPRADQVVDNVDGRLQVAIEEPLHDQHAVVELAFVCDLSWVGHDVVVQTHDIGEHADQRTYWPSAKRLGWELKAGGELGQVCRELRSTRLAAHLDVVDWVGDPILHEVLDLPQIAFEVVLHMSGELPTPVRRHAGRGRQ
jgi:hypothetical protein